jgi:diguanylate cyclase (GGDEF)-like protein
VSGRAGGSHLRPVLAFGPYAVWWWMITTIASVRLVQVLWSSGVVIRNTGLAYVMVLAFVTLSELRRVVVSEQNEGVSLSWAFLFASMLFWGPAVALLAVLICGAVSGLASRKRVHVVVFNLAQWSLTYAATWWMLDRLGWDPLAERSETFALADVPTVLVAALLWYVANTVLVGVAVGLVEHRSVSEAIVEDLAYFALTTWSVLALSPVIIVLLEYDWRFLPFLLAPLYMVHHVATIAHAQEQRVLRDELTGLGNRALFVRRFEELAPSSRGFAVCLLDLDRFKPINDTHGHAVGDEILRHFAERLRSVLRPGDTAVRLGGDEFAVILDAQESEEVERSLHRIVAHVTRPYDVDGLRLAVGVSFGTARSPEEGSELGELLRVADLRMYEAKRSSKGEPPPAALGASGPNEVPEFTRPSGSG